MDGKSETFTLNSSVESQDPIFNNAVKAGEAAEPNSRAEANKGSNCRNQEIKTKGEIKTSTIHLKLKF